MNNNEEKNNVNLGGINQGTDYIGSNVNQEVKTESVVVNTAINNNFTAENIAPIADKPIINKEAAKAKADEIVNKAKSGFKTYQEKLKNDKKVLYISIGVGVITLLLVILFLVNVVFNPAKAVVRQYAKGMVKMDAEKIVELFHEDLLDNEYFDKDDMIDLMEDNFESLEDKDYFYKKFKIDNDYKKYDKDEVEEIAENLEELYDIDEKDVKEIRRYTVRFVVDNDGDNDDEKIKILVIKIKGKWYLFNE